MMMSYSRGAARLAGRRSGKRSAAKMSSARAVRFINNPREQNEQSVMDYRSSLISMSIIFFQKSGALPTFPTFEVMRVERFKCKHSTPNGSQVRKVGLPPLRFYELR